MSDNTKLTDAQLIIMASQINIEDLRNKLDCGDCQNKYKDIRNCINCWENYQKKISSLPMSSIDLNGNIPLEL